VQSKSKATACERSYFFNKKSAASYFYSQNKNKNKGGLRSNTTFGASVASSRKRTLFLVSLVYTTLASEVAQAHHSSV
jgi:hypothetical protein